jgi:hypothetical protein
VNWGYIKLMKRTKIKQGCVSRLLFAFTFALRQLYEQAPGVFYLAARRASHNQRLQHFAALHQLGLTVSPSPYPTSAAYSSQLPTTSRASFHKDKGVSFLCGCQPLQVPTTVGSIFDGGRTFLSIFPLKEKIPITPHTPVYS